MHCSSCSKLIESTLNKNEFVKDAKVNFWNNKALVDFDETKISENEIMTLVEKAWYKATKEEEKQEKTKKDIERAILVEVEKAVDLVGQENIKHVKIVENKVVIVCEVNTNLDALLVRYGVMAFVKKTLNEIIIAVDIDFILKSRLNAK